MVMRVTETIFCNFELFATSFHLFKHILPTKTKKNSIKAIFDQANFSVFEVLSILASLRYFKFNAKGVY